MPESVPACLLVPKGAVKQLQSGEIPGVPGALNTLRRGLVYLAEKDSLVVTAVAKVVDSFPITADFIQDHPGLPPMDFCGNCLSALFWKSRGACHLKPSFAARGSPNGTGHRLPGRLGV